MKVAASGWVRRIALTTVKPSPASPMFRSERSTSNVCLEIRFRASETVEAAVTSKPRCFRMAAKVARIPGSSSTNNRRGLIMLHLQPVHGHAFYFAEDVRHTRFLLSGPSAGEPPQSGHPRRYLFEYRRGPKVCRDSQWRLCTTKCQKASRSSPFVFNLNVFASYRG